MEIMYAKDTSDPHTLLSTKCHDNFLLVSCNWQITNNKQFIDAITTAPLQHMPARINCEDVAFLNTCISLQPAPSDVDSSIEPCMLDIKVTNCQKIARIAIVSEGNVLEIFKQFGEYETTIFTEFIDEYDENIVFLGEATIQPPTTEVSIKFTRTKNKGPSMWVYGIRLFLTDSTKEAKPSAFNYDIIQTFLSNVGNGKGGKKAEIAMRLLEESNYTKPEIVNKNEQFSTVYQKCFETPTLDPNNFECKIGKRDNEKECLNCADNHEKTASFECKNNVSNGKRSEGDEMRMRTLGESFYNKQEIMSNEQLSAIFQKYLKFFTSDSNHLEYKNEIGRRDNEKECPSKDDCEKTNSFEYRNRNVRRDSKKDYPNHREDHEKSDIDIRTYIDNKFHDMEKRLMERIDKMEASTNQKLDAILERFEARLNLK